MGVSAGHAAILLTINVDINLGLLEPPSPPLLALGCTLLSSGITDCWASHPRGRSQRAAPNQRLPAQLRQPARAPAAGSTGRPPPLGGPGADHGRTAASQASGVPISKQIQRKAVMWRMSLSLFYSCTIGPPLPPSLRRRLGA